MGGQQHVTDNDTATRDRTRADTATRSSARNRTADPDCDSTATQSSAPPSGTAPVPHPQQHRTRNSTRTSSSPASARVLRTAHPRLPRAFLARRVSSPIARNSRFISNLGRSQPPPAHARVVTPTRRRPPEPGRTRSGGDRHRAVSERQRVTCSQFGRQQSGRFGDDCAKLGSQPTDDTAGDDQ